MVVSLWRSLSEGLSVKDSIKRSEKSSNVHQRAIGLSHPKTTLKRLSLSAPPSFKGLESGVQEPCVPPGLPDVSASPQDGKSETALLDWKINMILEKRRFCLLIKTLVLFVYGFVCFASLCNGHPMTNDILLCWLLCCVLISPLTNVIHYSRQEH